jgi:hypothetical protein
MTNFQAQMDEAIATYSSISGETLPAIVAKIAADPTGITAEIVKLLMFAAR